MRAVCIALVLLGVLAASVQAKHDYYRNPGIAGGLDQDGKCPIGMSFENRASSYSSANGRTTGMCKFDFEKVCVTPTGVVACNIYSASCRDTKKSWKNIQWYTDIAMNDAPQMCSELGAARPSMHSDAGVIAAAEPAFAFPVFLIALLLTLIPVIGKGNGGRAFTVFVLWAIAAWISSVIIMFSYFYLNAFIAVMVICISLGCYSSKCPVAISAGMLALFLALLWFTFESGLGAIQHHNRLLSANSEPIKMMYENACVQYYRGFFAYEFWSEDDKANPESLGTSYCMPNWTANVFFFITFIKILSGLMIFQGALILHNQQGRGQSAEEPKSEGAATTV